MQTYLILKKDIRVEQEIKRSKFITTLSKVSNRQEAMVFINKVKSEFPDASHNCWAFIAGNPTNTTDIGMSDEGEPKGTAGKPMLNILQHSGAGEFAVVVTRYFGGTKLGTGGLVRAYSGSVQQAIESADFEERIEYSEVIFNISYEYESQIRYIIDNYKLNAEFNYENSVKVSVKAPQDIEKELIDQIKNKTNGKVEFL